MTLLHGVSLITLMKDVVDDCCYVERVNVCMCVNVLIFSPDQRRFVNVECVVCTFYSIIRNQFIGNQRSKIDIFVRPSFLI